MDGHIAHLHISYRYLSNRDNSVSVASRLDRLAKDGLASVYEQALDRALEDDSTVYILRHVRARTLLDLGENSTDETLTKRWGQKLAISVVRSIFDDDNVNLVRFANQAEYTASFITDLLRDHAWDRWYYDAFAHLKTRGTANAICRVLQDNRTHLPAILVALQKKNALTKVTALLTEPMLSGLWSKETETDQTYDKERYRPLFAVALRLINQLDLWLASPPVFEAVFQTYVESRKPEIDWQDSVSLAWGVVDIIGFLAEKTYLRPLYATSDDEFNRRLDKALEELHWLDRAWLRTAVIRLLAKKDATEAELPARSGRGGLTPRQRDLLADLIAVLRAGQVTFNRQQPAATANAIRWYAALIVYAPRWSEGELAANMIQRLLSAWAKLARTRVRSRNINQYLQRDKNTLVMSFPADQRHDVAEAIQFLNLLGKPGGDIIDELEGLGEQESSTGNIITGGEIVETEHAGIFLLLRVILDLRLPQLVESTGYPFGEPKQRLGALLASFGLIWSGTTGIRDGQIDAGVNLFAGVDARWTPESLKSVWSNTSLRDHAQFQEALLFTLAGQRVLKGETLNLYAIETEDGFIILIAGDASGRLWPLGYRLNTRNEIPAVVKDWLLSWSEATGIEPSVVCDKEIGIVLSESGTEHHLIISEAKNTAADNELSNTYWHGREVLLEALKTLQKGRIGLPTADLSLTLMAATLLCVWARWLRQFADSSVAYLLENFIHRSGQVTVEKERIVVNMESKGLDLVIEMAGYAADLAPVAWLGDRRIQFRLGS